MSILDPSLTQMEDDPPPPAYSEQEFEQKVTAAVEASLHAAEASVGDEEWEVWDETVFQAEAAKVHGQDSGPQPSSSSAPASSHIATTSPYPQEKVPVVEPLHIRKKSGTNLPLVISKPSLDQVRKTNSVSDPPSDTTCQTSVVDGQAVTGPRDATPIIENPPPPFTIVGPSLDGPPYIEHEAISLSPSPVPQGSTTVLVSTMRMPEPSVELVMPDIDEHQTGSSSPTFKPQIPPHQYRQTLPAVTQTALQPEGVRPATMIDLGTQHNQMNMTAGLLVSNPYTRNKRISGLERAYLSHDQSQAPVDASAFYNSAVSAHLRGPRLPPHQRSTASTASIHSQSDDGFSPWHPPRNQRPTYAAPSPPTVPPFLSQPLAFPPHTTNHDYTYQNQFDPYAEFR